jgi:uncharacterized ion transporter superfamily protein YfcC
MVQKNQLLLMKRKIPHTYVLIFILIILVAVLTWLIPGGEYTEQVRLQDGQEIKELVFQRVESQPQTWEVFAALFKGFERQADIIVFILMIGGAFWIMNSSKAIDVGILSFLKFTRGLEKNRVVRFIGVDNVVITLVMLIFSVFGAVFGMSEETIAFIIVMVPLAISMGYDSIVGVSMCFVAAGLGFAGAMLNPFTIGIAQSIAGLPLFSGIEYRFFCWVVINIAGIGYVLWYAKKIRKDPKRSLVYEDDTYWRDKEVTEIESLVFKASTGAWISYVIILAGLVIFSFLYPMAEMKVGNASLHFPALPIVTAFFAITGPLTLRKSAQGFILSLLLYTIVFLIIGVMGFSWYIMQIATLFFAMGIFAGFAAGYDGNKITALFLDGTKDIMSAALVVGLAGGIIVILEDGRIVDSILYSMASSLEGMGSIASIGFMYVIQNIINIIIVSGSAKAALTMPIMAPFSDLIDLSRQATVMAFQFGDGFTNMITPTSGVLIGVLGVAKIPYDKWVRWVWPLILMLLVLGFLLLVPTVTMELNGF